MTVANSLRGLAPAPTPRLAKSGARSARPAAASRRTSRLVRRQAGSGDNPLEAAQEFFGGLFKEKEDPVPIG